MNVGDTKNVVGERKQSIFRRRNILLCAGLVIAGSPDSERKGARCC